MSGQVAPNPDDIELYRRIMWCVNVAVKPIYRRYRRIVHMDDLRQECWLWAVEHRGWTRQALTVSDAYLVRRLRGVAERYARKEKAARGGYSADDEMYYSTATIANLLPEALDPQAVTPTGQASEIRGSSERYMEWETSIVDVRGAVAKLTPKEKYTLQWWLDTNIDDPPPEVTTILRKMQKSLGGARPDNGENK